MNFLGHAYIARNHPHLVAGNFAGDSYKGMIKNFDHLPSDIFNGIKLHRYIDDFTDTSEFVIQVCRIFRDHGVKKIGFIASDILLDHHLSSRWPNYSDVNYEHFVDQVYLNTEIWLDQLHPEFQWMYSHLKQYGWLFDYPTVDGIEKILRQFSRRIGFENDLLKTLSIYQDNKEKIDHLYEQFLWEIDKSSDKFILEKLRQNP